MRKDDNQIICSIDRIKDERPFDKIPYNRIIYDMILKEKEQSKILIIIINFILIKGNSYKRTKAI